MGQPSHAVAVDFGGTRMRAALVTRTGDILRRTSAPTDKNGPKATIAQIRAMIAGMREGTATGDIAGVGISSIGPLDTVTGTILTLPNMPGWENLPFRDLVQDGLDLPVKLENDALAATLGEWHYGAGKGAQNLCYVTVSTGIGGGVIMDGRLIHGRRGMATHVGHMSIEINGRRCGCGNLGCWEAYASGTHFRKIACERAGQTPSSSLHRLGQEVDVPDVVDAARSGDALALQLVQDEALWLGIGIVGLLHLYSPEKVVLGGGIANAAFDLLHPRIHQRIQDYAMLPFRDVPVVPAELGGNSGLIGAAALAF